MSRVTVSTVGLPGLEANDNAVVSPTKVILVEVWLCAEKSPHAEERPASRGVTPALYRVSKDGNDSTFVGKTLAADQTPPFERGRTAAAGRLAATVAQGRRTLRPERARREGEAERRRGRVRVHLRIEVDELNCDIPFLWPHDPILALERDPPSVRPR